MKEKYNKYIHVNVRAYPNSQIIIKAYLQYGISVKFRSPETDVMI